MCDVKFCSSLFLAHHSVSELGRPEETKQEFQANFFFDKTMTITIHLKVIFDHEGVQLHKIT